MNKKPISYNIPKKAQNSYLPTLLDNAQLERLGFLKSPLLEDVLHLDPNAYSNLIANHFPNFFETIRFQMNELFTEEMIANYRRHCLRNRLVFENDVEAANHLKEEVWAYTDQIARTQFNYALGMVSGEDARKRIQCFLDLIETSFEKTDSLDSITAKSEQEDNPSIEKRIFATQCLRKCRDAVQNELAKALNQVQWAVKTASRVKNGSDLFKS